MKFYIGLCLFFGGLVQCLARFQQLPFSFNQIHTKVSPSNDKPAFCRNLECPEYTVVSKQKEDKYELRKYVSARWVSTDIYDIDMKDAGSDAFYRLFDYISGENEDNVKIDMTAPVINHVIPGAGPLCENNFTYSFFVPFKYQQSGPPAPTSADVYLSTLKEHLAYVRQFPGRMKTAADWVAEADSLIADLTADGLIEQVNQTFFYTAGYDSPFQLFNRHNEIWLFVKSSGNDVGSQGIFTGNSDGNNQDIFKDNKLRL